MIAAPIPANESERLASLRKLNILDTPLEERYERLTRLLCKMLDVPMAAFTLVDDNRQWFKSIQGLSSTETERKLSFCAHVVAGDDMMHVPNATEDHRFSDHPMVTNNPNIAFYAGCPVRSPDGKTIGALCAIDTKPRQLDPEQLEALRDLAALVENEVRMSEMQQTQGRLKQELDAAHRLALIDPLTRLWNRNGMDEILKREWADCLRKKIPITFVMADIDHFKKVNDTYGHPVGDEVLQVVAKRLLGALRTEDAVGRMGGEEFLMVLPGCAEDQIPAIVGRIREAVIQSPIPTAASALPITVSYGASVTIPSPDSSFEDMIKQADDALYAAKKGGRNRIELAA